MFNFFFETCPVYFLVVGKGFGCLLESFLEKFSVMLIVMRMGRWSEWSAVLVCHCVLLSRLEDIIVSNSKFIIIIIHSLVSTFPCL